MSTNSFVYQLSKEQIQDFLLLEIEGKCEPIEHALFSAKSPGLSINLYKSGKLLIQGKRAQQWVHYHLEPLLLSEKIHNKDRHYGQDSIGADETGKGDYFGPLCLAALYIPKQLPSNFSTPKTAISCTNQAFGFKTPEEYLEYLGIQDSKKIPDKKILEIAPKIKKVTFFTETILRPSQYNALYKKIPNLNAMMRYLHKKTIEELMETLKTQNCIPNAVMIDQFSPDTRWLDALKGQYPSTQIRQETKAEKYLSVACASIIARERFIKEMNALSKKAGFCLPKGAGSSVDQSAKKLLGSLKSGSFTSEIDNYSLMTPWVKWHFANSRKIGLK